MKSEKLNTVKNAEVDVKLSEMVAYTAGGFANDFVWTGVLSFLTLFWTDYLLIPAALCGTFMLICRLWDAVNDPIIGSLADRTHTKFGQYRTWYRASYIPMAVLFVLVFTKVTDNLTLQIVFSFIVYFLLVVCNTAVMIPYYSLSANITTSAKGRGKLVSTRMAGGHAGAIITSFLFFPLIIALGRGDMVKGFPLAAIVIVAISIPFWLWGFLGTKERVIQPVPQKVKQRDILAALKKNNPFWCLFIGFLAWGAASGLMSGMKVYFFKYNLNNEGAFANCMAIWFLGQCIASFCMRFFYKNLKKKRTIPMIGFLVATAINLFQGLYPFSADSLTLYMVISFISGIFMGMGLSGMFNMVPDVTEYTQDKNGLRSAGFIAAFINFANKLGIAIFTAICGWVMTAAGYIANADIQSPAITALFRYGVHWGTAVTMIIAFVCMLIYKLDNDSFEKILNRLEEKGE